MESLDSGSSRLIRLGSRKRYTGSQTIPIKEIIVDKYRTSMLFNSKMQELGLNLLKPSSNVTDLKRLITIYESPEEYSQNIHSRFVISRSSRLKLSFDFFMNLMVTYSVLSSLYWLSFGTPSEVSTNFDFFVWSMFFIDFSLNFFTDYTNYHRRVIKNLQMIAKNYAKGWMIFDILSLLPLSLANNERTEYMLRLFRIFKMNRLVKKLNINRPIDLLAGCLHKNETRAKKNTRLILHQAWNLIKELLTMLFVTICLACLWWYYANLIVRRKDENRDFLDYFSLNSKSSADQFIITWYFIFTTLMTVGYGDLYATNKYEMGLAIILLVAGPTWFAFTMGKAISIIEKLYTIGGKEDKMGQLNIWLSKLEHEKQIMPIKLKEKIQDHFLYFWRNDRLGSMANIATENDENFSKISHGFLNQLPKAMQLKIIDHMFDDFFYRFKYFFKHFGEVKHIIVLYIQPRIYPANSIILDANELPQEVFFKTNGTIIISSTMEKTITTTKERNLIIGDFCAFKNTESAVQYKAVESVHGYGLPVHVLKDLLKNYQSQVERYLHFISDTYERLHEEGSENTTFLTMKTVNRTECYESPNKSRNQLAMEGLSHKYREHVLSQNVENKEDLIFQRVHEVNNRIGLFKTSRKKSISGLKEQLVDHIVKNTREL